jgi:putative ABC transport system substrate-binding protein
MTQRPNRILNVLPQNIFAAGRADRFTEFATEMVQLKVDVVIVVTTPAALAVKKATATIPSVHPNAIDPWYAPMT